MGAKHKRLIGRIIDWDNLVRAHQLARRGKRDRLEVAHFEEDLWANLGRLQMELAWGEYRPGRYRSFTIREPKVREILALPYRDRVVQHAVCNLCAPIFDRAMIPDSYACRPGKGTHAGADRIQGWLRDMRRSSDNPWFLKMDVSSYFPSIPHKLAKRVVRRKISCPETLRLIDRIIDSTAGEDEADPRGIPVGNLTSQWIANLVGNEIDQWAKRELRLKRYVRYMDDMVVLAWDKDELLRIREAFQEKLAELGFEFSKTSVLPTSRGINFLGYRIWHDHRLLRKDSVVRARRRFKHLQGLYARGLVSVDRVRQFVQSWLAHAMHADSFEIRKEIMDSIVFQRS
jgi:retron-type reverse transcriptase